MLGAVLVESYDLRMLRFERFEDSAESSNRILKPKDVESNLESNLKISGAESNIESNLKISWTRLEY